MTMHAKLIDGVTVIPDNVRIYPDEYVIVRDALRVYKAKAKATLEAEKKLGTSSRDLERRLRILDGDDGLIKRFKPPGESDDEEQKDPSQLSLIEDDGDEEQTFEPMDDAALQQLIVLVIEPAIARETIAQWTSSERQAAEAWANASLKAQEPGKDLAEVPDMPACVEAGVDAAREKVEPIKAGRAE